MRASKTISAGGGVSSAGIPCPTSLASSPAVSPMTSLESRFWLLWNCEFCAGGKLVRQHRFAPPRRWKFDFADLSARVAVELEGGTWAGYGRGGSKRGGWHQHPKVYADNCEKYNEAAFAGWIVFRLTTEQVTPETVKRIAEFCRDREDENERNGYPE